MNELQVTDVSPGAETSNSRSLMPASFRTHSGMVL